MLLQMLAAPGAAVLAVLLMAGIVTGILSGLLGIGGGVVAVPVLLEVFAAQGIAEPLQAPLAIGTAHAGVILASLSAALAHHRAGRVDVPLLRAWLPPVVAGAVAGLAVAQVAPSNLLVATFAVVAIGLGAAMLGGGMPVAASLPQGLGGLLPPALIGLLASALGIGGGTLSGPVLTLLGTPLHRAVGAGAVFNIVVAGIACGVFVAGGLGVPGRPPDALGFVAVLPLLLLAVPALVTAPWAARLSLRLPVRLLRRGFAICMFAVAARVFWRLLGLG